MADCSFQHIADLVSAVVVQPKERAAAPTAAVNANDFSHSSLQFVRPVHWGDGLRLDQPRPHVAAAHNYTVVAGSVQVMEEGPEAGAGGLAAADEEEEAELLCDELADTRSRWLLGRLLDVSNDSRKVPQFAHALHCGTVVVFCSPLTMCPSCRPRVPCCRLRVCRPSLCQGAGAKGWTPRLPQACPSVRIW